MFMSVAGQPIDQFAGVAKEFVTNFSKEYLSGKPIDPYAIYGAQAAQVMLDAIGASDGSRSDVITKMFATTVDNGLLGSFTFNENGDPQGRAVPSSRSRSTRRRTSSRRRGHLAEAGDGRRSDSASRHAAQCRGRARSDPDTRSVAEGIALPPHICLESPDDGATHSPSCAARASST